MTSERLNEVRREIKNGTYETPTRIRATAERMIAFYCPMNNWACQADGQCCFPWRCGLSVIGSPKAVSEGAHT